MSLFFSSIGEVPRGFGPRRTSVLQHAVEKRYVVSHNRSPSELNPQWLLPLLRWNQIPTPFPASTRRSKSRDAMLHTTSNETVIDGRYGPLVSIDFTCHFRTTS